MARQRQVQEQTAAPHRVPVSADRTISFPQGVMHVAGVRQDIRRIIERRSSNGLTKYVAIEWSHPATGELRTSCNCPGWTRHAARSCKHTQEFDNNHLVGAEYADEVQLPTQITARARPVDQIIDGKHLRGFTFD